MKKYLIASVAGAAIVAAGVAIAHPNWGRGDDGGRHGGYYEDGRFERGHGRKHGRWGHDRRGRGEMRRGGRGARMEALFDELDANGDGSLTKEEVENAKTRRFELMDANSDGFVEAEEIVAYRMKRRAEAMIKRLDKDGDGKLSLEEAPQRRTPSFDRFDLDENGAVTKTEIEQAMKRRGPGRRRAPADADQTDDAQPEEAVEQ